MGTRALINRIEKIREMEAKKKEIESQIESLKTEIKSHMTESGIDECNAGDYIVRYKMILTPKFDTKKFKSDHSELYGAYSSVSEVYRLTIN